MAPSADFTPVKVRGKRRGRPAEKWRSGKRRKPELQTRPTPLNRGGEDSSRASSSRPRKRRRQDDCDGPLEALPAEILQEIFEYAGNVELATVSRQLALKLSKSQHLQNELTTRLLEPALHNSQRTATNTECAAATRLLDSRFMTWEFFKAWLKSYAHEQTPSFLGSGEMDWPGVWRSLQPCPDLLPPKKLLLAPFTPSKVSFLAALAQSITDVHTLDAAFGELAQEGMLQAVNDGNFELVSLLMNMGASTSTELVRAAVADSGCNQEIVEMLVRRPVVGDQSATASSSAVSSGNPIDVLDPVLWKWAEYAQQQGNPKGKWLIALLRDEQRRKEHRSGASPSLSG